MARKKSSNLSSQEILWFWLVLIALYFVPA